MQGMWENFGIWGEMTKKRSSVIFMKISVPVPEKWKKSSEIFRRKCCKFVWWSANRDTICQVVRESEKVENRWNRDMSINDISIFHGLAIFKFHDFLGLFMENTCFFPGLNFFKSNSMTFQVPQDLWQSWQSFLLHCSKPFLTISIF